MTVVNRRVRLYWLHYLNPGWLSEEASRLRQVSSPALNKVNYEVAVPLRSDGPMYSIRAVVLRACYGEDLRLSSTQDPLISASGRAGLRGSSMVGILYYQAITSKTLQMGLPRIAPPSISTFRPLVSRPVEMTEVPSFPARPHESLVPRLSRISWTRVYLKKKKKIILNPSEPLARV